MLTRSIAAVKPQVRRCIVRLGYEDLPTRGGRLMLALSLHVSSRRRSHTVSFRTVERVGWLRLSAKPTCPANAKVKPRPLQPPPHTPPRPTPAIGSDGSVQ
jgi:hypothetical protein